MQLKIVKHQLNAKMRFAKLQTIDRTVNNRFRHLQGNPADEFSETKNAACDNADEVDNVITMADADGDFFTVQKCKKPKVKVQSLKRINEEKVADTGFSTLTEMLNDPYVQELQSSRNHNQKGH